MFATQVLPEFPASDNDSEEANASELVGYIIVDDKNYEVKTGETKIGRDSLMCSIVIDNFTVSKVHAIIESEGIDDTFIYDVGSTNQTKLGKKVLKPHCRYKLGDESKLTLGNVTAKFILPPDKSLSLNLEKKKPSSVYLNPLDELGDIFDVPTQATVPQSSSSSETVIFEKNNDTIHHIKNTKSLVFTKIEKTPEISQTVFDEVTQCKLDSTKKTPRVAHLFENSGIFNLNTQFQLYEPSIIQDEKSDVKVLCSDKNSELDKVKALLNDGQDDVLCTFMSSHSPKGQIEESSIETKIKTDVSSISHVSNTSQGSLQLDIIQKTGESSETKLKDVIGTKDLNKHFSHSSLCKPSITSTPLNQRFKLKHHSNASKVSSNSTLTEEDYIKTQEFNVDGLTSDEKYNYGSHSHNEKSQPYVQEALNHSPTSEQEDVDEDLTLTQTFEVLEKHSDKEARTVIPESEDLITSEDDFIQTQIYEVENRKNNVEKEIFKYKKFEGPDKNVECHLNDTLDFTQRNNQDDFISTQVFEERTGDRKKDVDDEENDSNDDEDFICTQPVKFLLLEPRNSRNRQEKSTEVETISRESSPDLLGPGGTWKNIEDCIATQIFEVPEGQKPASTLTEVTKPASSNLSHCLESEKHDSITSHTKISNIVDSSGDETESDLEILLDKNETRRDKNCAESFLSSFKVELDSEGSLQARRSETPESSSNASYIFALEPENHFEQVSNNEFNQKPVVNLSDSDATDCEELAFVYPKISIKQEPSNKTEIEETPRLALRSPNDVEERTNYTDDDQMTDRESSKFEIGNENTPLSPLSLEMPNTQDIEITMNRLLQSESEKKEDFERPSKIKKIEVGINKSEENKSCENIEPLKRQVDSPLKRPLDNNTNTTDIVPSKKSKIETLDRFLKSIEKQFSKLVQTHDIGQIQPSRTRNSLKVLSKENSFNKADGYLGNNIINEGPTSRRKPNTKRRSTKKPNGDIKPFLTRKIEAKRSFYGGGNKETSPKEFKEESKPIEGSFRILRSSRRNYGNPAPTVLAESPINNVRRSKRNSRSKSGEYFSNPCVNVVFTGFDCESLDKIIYSLGGKKTNDLSCGEVVVADKIRRTVKFLCAIGLSLPITSPQWLLSCKKEKKFINPWNFILQDEESEEKWNFNLRTSLERSKNVKLLQGFSVYATKSIQPPVKDLLVIVECCGGIPISQPPDVWPKNTIVVSCLEDKKWWPLAKRNMKIVHYEFILSGVLKQKIDFKTYKLR